MASGLAGVATEHGGIPEIIENGATGLLCQEGDRDGLAGALLRLAEDPSLLSRISRAGSDFVRREFSEDKQIANIENLYREACGSR
jgi:glycosyltransferase involved in cell wall biosynthesis